MTWLAYKPVSEAEENRRDNRDCREHLSRIDIPEGLAGWPRDDEHSKNENYS